MVLLQLLFSSDYVWKNDSIIITAIVAIGMIQRTWCAIRKEHNELLDLKMISEVGLYFLGLLESFPAGFMGGDQAVNENQETRVRFPAWGLFLLSSGNTRSHSDWWLYWRHQNLNRLGRLFTYIGGSNHDDDVTLANTFSIIMFFLRSTKRLAYVTSSSGFKPPMSVNIRTLLSGSCATQITYCILSKRYLRVGQ